MKLKAALDEFIVAGRADGLAKATLRWYTSLLTPLAAHFQVDLESVTARALREYIVSLRERGLAESSVASHVTALHAFFGWISREYGLENPMRNIKRAKRPNLTPKAIDPKDFVKLLAATGDDPAGVRDRAILCFLADTGCRLGGLVKLKLENLQIAQRRAIVTEKGNKARVVVFTRYTARLLRNWLGVRMSPNDRVFISMTKGTPLTESGVHQVLKRLKRRSGVRGRVNPHSFRHNFARSYLQNGGDLATLARLLGHQDINTTTNFYALFTQDELAELHEKFSPMHNMRRAK